MPRRFSPRPLAALTAVLAVALAGQTAICSRAADCAMNAAPTASAPTCTPAMGLDCCAREQSRQPAPRRADEQGVKLAPAVLALPAAAPALSAVRCAWAFGQAPRPAAAASPVPLYTLLATLLI